MSETATVYEAWWEKDEADVGQTLMGFYTVIRSKQRNKTIIDHHHLRLYGNYDVAGTGHYDMSLMDLVRGDDGRMRYQLCTAIVDSAVPIVTSNKPMPYFSTEGGSFTDQRTAKRLTQALDGQLYDLGAYDFSPLVARDAMIHTNGGCVWGQLDPDTNLPMLERVNPLDLWVDLGEAVAGEVRTLYREHRIAREKCQTLWGKNDEKLAKLLKTSAGPTIEKQNDFFLQFGDSTADLVIVVEAIHLPTSDGADDGRRVLATSNATLVDEKWEENEFPVARMVWKDRAVGGWFGCGLIEETKAAQLRVNKLIRHDETLTNIASKIWVILEKGGGIVPEQIVAGMKVPVQVIQTQPGSQAPVFYKHDTTNGDLMTKIQAIKLDAMEQVGLSAQQVQGEKPSGITSSVGLQTQENIASRRHVENVRQYERYFMQLAKLLMRLNDRASKLADERSEKYYVNAFATRGKTQVVDKVEWKEMKIKGPSVMRMYPISSLPSTPAGKWDRVMQWLNLGFLDFAWARKLLDVPDLDEALSYELAHIDTILAQVEKIFDGETVHPMPYQDLQLALEIGTKAWLKAWLLGAESDVLTRLSAFLDEAKSILPPMPEGGPAMPNETAPALQQTPPQVPQAA